MKQVFYDWGGLNAWLFYLLNGLHSGFSDLVMQIGTSLGGHGNFPLYLALVAWFALIRVVLGAAPQSLEAQHQREAGLRWLAVIAVFSAGYVVDGWIIGWLKQALDFPRPASALALGSVHIVGERELRHSLPSGHSSFAMLVAASLWPVLNRPLRVAAVAFVLWVGWSRIAVGAHFPADVLAGYAKTLLLVLALHGVVRLIRRSFAVAKPLR